LSEVKQGEPFSSCSGANHSAFGVGNLLIRCCFLAEVF
jgi:hypothetical protein